MKLAAWNVNSLRVRLGHVLAWLDSVQPDLLALQETKLTDDKFPKAALEEAGYHVIFAGQPTYNGVAILAKQSRFQPPTQVVVNNPSFPDEQMRLIGGTFATHAASASEPPVTIRFFSAYVPNGSEVGSDKYAYKLKWLDQLVVFLRQELAQHQHLAIAGDYNIAPEDRDVHDPSAWKDQVLCSVPERERFGQLLALGLTDAYRLFEQPESQYSWWDYRQAAFRRNRGLRIDHLLLSPALASTCSGSGIDAEPRKKEQPSDHAPVWAKVLGE